MNYVELNHIGSIGAYYGPKMGMHVMDDFGTLVPLNHGEGSKLLQWSHSIGSDFAVH